MSIFFTNNRFYPQNFVMRNSADVDMMEIAYRLAEDAKCIAPSLFNGTVPVFPFQLRYCPPYQSFMELKRLQAEAIFHTHFKDEFRGFIAIDLTEWAQHVDEELFCKVSVPFLADMMSEWHYVFCFDDLKSDSQILSVLTDAFWCCDISEKALRLQKRISVRDVLQKEGITFDGRAKAIVEHVFNNAPIPLSTVSHIVHDAIAYFGKQRVVGAKELTEYLKGDTYAHAFLIENEVDFREPHEKESA